MKKSSLQGVLVVLFIMAATSSMAQNGTAGSGTSNQADNTQVNAGDGSNGKKTAQDQSSTKSDTQTAAAVRKAIVKDKSLSTYAHNVKVIVNHGAVTLRGPVRSADEKQRVSDLATQAANGGTVQDQLTIKASK